MEGELQKGFHLEDVLDKLLDFQAAKGADCVDSMLMLSLVNLLGIISLLNKQSGVAVSAQAPGAMNPLLGMLLNMLSGQQEIRAAESGPGPGALTPAALMSLLGSPPGKTPDPSGLFKMLGSLLGGPGRPPAPAEVSEQPEQKLKIEGVPPGKVKEMKKAEGPIKWDPRLGNATA